LTLVSCGQRVISRGDLAEIYAEMLLTDQWISSNPRVRHIADTSLVYAPILDKYGYTKEEYVRSIDKYMDDPERFSRILRTTGEILDEKLKDLQLRKEELQRIEEYMKYLKQFVGEVHLDIDEYFPFMFKEPYVHYFDSIAVDVDTLNIYHLKNIEISDTTFSGPRIMVRDTLSVGDSIQIIKEDPWESKE
jgi:hypothetical protein